MASFSYNETKERQAKFRHIFLPSGYGFLCEVVIAVVALVVFNVSNLGNQFFTKNFDNADPLPMWGQIINNFLNGIQSIYAVQQIMLFLLWALVGALLYILVFRILQVTFGVKRSVTTGIRFVRKEHTQGFFHWMASLHDFFLAAIIVILGGSAILFGSFVCFGIASQELRNGLTVGIPGNLGKLLLSLVAAVLSVRLIALGLSLISKRFRNWYTT